MHTFPCRYCRQPITVPDTMLGQSTSCPHCQTPQVVPPDAPIAPEPPAAVAARHDAPHFSKDRGTALSPPGYILPVMIAGTLWFVGVIGMITGLFAIFDHGNPTAWGIFFASLVCIALAQLLDLTRTIARQTYRPIGP
jgi:hypothetical protein